MNSYPGGGNSHMKGVGMLFGNFELNPPKETNLGVAQPFFLLLKEAILNFDYMNRVYKTNRNYKISLYFFACNPKRDLYD